MPESGSSRSVSESMRKMCLEHIQISMRGERKWETKQEDRKMMKEVEQYEAIKRQQQRKKQPYKSLIYSGKKALGAGRENK